METVMVVGEQLTRLGYPPRDPHAVLRSWFGKATEPLIAYSRSRQMHGRDELRWFVAMYEPSWLPPGRGLGAPRA